jgi:hypothetical protein
VNFCKIPAFRTIQNIDGCLVFLPSTSQPSWTKLQGPQLRSQLEALYVLIGIKPAAVPYKRTKDIVKGLLVGLGSAT